jgi:UDP-N-acetylmuramoyl-L-alanyl-D-glutamate--2,6-diaminopimelate ligase
MAAAPPPSVDALLRAAGGVVRRPPAAPAAPAGDVRHDAREVRTGDAFVALRGDAHDGHRWLPEVAAAGAALLVGTDAAALDDLVTRLAAGVPAAAGPGVVQVADGRDALWHICRARYAAEVGDLPLIGVTGTNGKTTTCWIVEAILRAAGGRPGVLGTVSYRFGATEAPSSHTTPESPALWRLLAGMRRDGATHVVMEVSSHAIVQRRVHGAPFGVTAFTNLTQDHLDFHPTFEEYWLAKRRLFLEVAPGAPAVVNVDDQHGAALAAELGARAVRTSAEGAPGAEVAPLDTPALDVSGIRCTLRTPAGTVEVRSPLLGTHNLANLCTAAGIAAAAGVPAAGIAAGIAALRGVPGRLERVAAGGGAPAPDVFVDYAHTPDALARVLAAVRPYATGRLVVLFGCGGDRDAGKRPLMGAAAVERADVVVVTSDNPRTEDPLRIIDDIRPGLAGAGPAVEVHVEPDRRAAIALALALARPGDVVVLAGKGHETYQIVGTLRHPFDDRQIATELLERANLGRAKDGEIDPAAAPPGRRSPV